MTADLDVFGTAPADQPGHNDLALRYRIELPAGDTAAGLARRAARQVLTSWGLDDAAETVVLLACELVTNAVRHVHTKKAPRAAVQDEVRPTGPELRLTAYPGVLRIEVFDADPQPPRPRTPGELDESGFGFVLVRALAGDWGSYPAATGKAAWADVPIRRPPEQAHISAETGGHRSPNSNVSSGAGVRRISSTQRT